MSGRRVTALRRLLLLTRPALLLWLLCLAAGAVATTWEGATAYDDGGIGTLSFAVLLTVGLPFLLAGQLFAALAAPLGTLAGFVVVPGTLLLGSAPYLWVDRGLTRWARGGPPPPAAASTASPGGSAR